MVYLLDTNVVSALRVRGRNPQVEAWSDSLPLTDQYTSVMTIVEIERGVLLKERKDPAQGSILRAWFQQQVLPAFSGRILPFDLSAARILDSYRVPEHAPLDDALIGAIAVANSMTVVTRNLNHFEPLGIPCLDPWHVG